MTLTHATAVLHVRLALHERLCARLDQRLVNVLYGPPEQDSDTKAPGAQDGNRDTVFLGGPSGGNAVRLLGVPVKVHESSTLDVQCESVRPAGHQHEADCAAEAMLTAVVDEVSNDPRLGIDTTAEQFGMLVVTMEGWTYEGGYLTAQGGRQPGHGARFTATLNVEAEHTHG